MSAQNNGGPAFPVLEGETQWLGMSLRDYFAAKAMHAILTAQPDRGTTSEVCGAAYRIANAMLKAREAA